ncbi:PREDICTED: GATA zinc finger domain-containing protein 7-like [Polistes dominula]|uniref:GATA zinc finger domain-containing protein 7-like n=1 Tax=Polistes dominula TaxID=743375 RepID=A0ABM1IEC4_POLDO|nr:PREDICTED: GATA zinc finger domain-containing protein 7-like [Polistes dominula]
MTNPNTVPRLRIDKKTLSTNSTVSDCSVVLLPYYEDQGSSGGGGGGGGISGREMLTTNGQTKEDYKRRITRQQNDKIIIRGSNDCQEEYRDYREMNLNSKNNDQTFNDFIIDRIEFKSYGEIDSCYERIADLQDYVQEDKGSTNYPMVNALDVLLERRNSLNNDNYDQNSSDASSDLVERGTIVRNKFNRNCPYSKNNSTNWSGRNQSFENNMSFTRKQQKIDKSKEVQTNGGICSIFENNWQGKNNDEQSNVTSKENNSILMTTTTTSIPSIVVNDHGENTVLTILGKGADHGAQVFSDASNSSIISQATRTWPDSPLSCYNNNMGISRPNSRCSNCAQPPTSGMQFESQLMPYNVSGSPIGSPQIPSTYTMMQGQSSPSSSSQSYGDIPSPLNYQKPVNRRIEERLHKDLACFSIWGNFLDDQGNNINETVPTFDSNELQLLDEVLRSQGNQCERNEEAQVVPRSDDYYSSSYDNRPSSVRTFENELERMSSCKNDTQTISSPSTSTSPYGEQQSNSFTNYSSSPNDLPYTYVATENPTTNSVTYGENQTQVNNLYDYNDVWNNMGNDMRYGNTNNLQSNMEFDNIKHDTYDNRQHSSNVTNSCSLPTSYQSLPTLSSVSTNIAENRRRRCTSTSGISYPNTSFNDFQIPEMVSSFKSNRSQRSNERTIMPWPSLNLPSTGASKRLKEELKPKDVEIAMSQLLEIKDEELTTVDNDGYTKLMCLMSNPEDLAKKKAYLVPLVERLSNFKDALSRKNNRGEDALYLAAICCPEMPYIAGYLAATMLQKGIDINQNLYHTRGDTLIHSVSARGDSHGEVLAELLALKTSQGYAVYDLSKCNYDGRTALHVAVESHDPTGRNIKAVATVRLLLDNGADLNIKDTKNGDTALHMAAGLSCDPALVKVLLSKAVSGTVNATNYNYNTPLHIAAACNTVPLEKQKEVCWLLTQAGGQTNIHNKQGKTPLALVSAERKDLIRRIFYKKF